MICQRPKSGTPHDWEDWERYHDDLADGAETLEQKIDKQAHQKALAKEKQQAQAAVEHFTPTAPTSETDSALKHQTPSPIASEGVPASPQPTSVLFAYRALAVLLPPLAVGLTEGGAKRVALSVVLTLLGWLPGVVHAFIWLKKH